MNHRLLGYALSTLLCYASLAVAAETAAETPPSSAGARLIYQPPVAARPIEEIDLEALKRRTLDVLIEMHVERDPTDPQFGLIYETYDPERKLWVEGEGRDTMHHMMWSMVGLSAAIRADGDERALDALKRYPLRFYLGMMLDGEKIFGSEYGAGFCPYYWDDGDSVELGGYLKGNVAAETRVDGFSPMSSIHLAQDLSVGHLDLWWLSSDPRLKQASADLYHQVHAGKIAERFAARNYALIEKKLKPAGAGLAKFRAAEVEGKEMLAKLSPSERNTLYAKQFPPQYGGIVAAAERTIGGDEKLPRLEPVQHKPSETLAAIRLADRKAGSIPAFPDEHAFDYYIELSRGSPEERIRPWFARSFTMESLTRSLLNEYWSDDAPYRHGYAHFPAFSTTWTMKDGRFATYRSQAKQHYWHTRGLHDTWLAAIALQMMETWPEMHEEYRVKTAADDPVVRFTDATPELDGRREAIYTDVFSSKSNAAVGEVAVASDPLSLFVFFRGEPKEPIEFTFYEGTEVGEHRLTIQLASDGAMKVVNGAGEELKYWSQRGPDGVEVQVPYQIYRPQGAWATAVEHRRNRIDVKRGDAAATTAVYFLSDAARIKTRLRAMVEGSIANHAEILEKQGWLPYSIPDKSRDRFAKLSFSGAYGHLIHAIAQYQLWKQGKRDWDAKFTTHVDLK